MLSQLNLYKQYFYNSKVFKYYSITLGIAIITDWLFIPFFIKYMGIYAITFFITLYYLISEISGIVISYFKNVTLTSSILILLILDTLQLFTYFVYFWDIKIMIFILMGIFSIQGAFFEIIMNKMIIYYEYKNEKFSIIQELLLLNKSSCVIIGLLISLLFSFVSITYLIITVIIFMTYNLYNEYKLYSYLKKEK